MSKLPPHKRSTTARSAYHENKEKERFIATTDPREIAFCSSCDTPVRKCNGYCEKVKTFRAQLKQKEA